MEIRRITFNEITPKAIREAVGSPTTIDMSKVNAQKARRVLDRIVGYSLSPLLWKKVKNGLSAGRVQSVALRLICEREKELEAFLPEEYWTIEAELHKGKSVFRALLVLSGRAEARPGQGGGRARRIESLKDALYEVRDVKQTEKLIRPRPPFTTSTLQQTAANRFGFTARKTMQVAQGLYEGRQHRRPAPGSHHLHAHRLHPGGRERPGGGPRVHRGGVPRRAARGGQPLRGRARARRTRTRPSARPSSPGRPRS